MQSKPEYGRNDENRALTTFSTIELASKQFKYKIALRKQLIGATSIQNGRGCPSSRLGRIDMISRRVFKKEKVIVFSISLGFIRIGILGDL